jgi:hypothetical protein
MFMEACYIARRNAITSSALENFRACVEKFHALRDIFIQSGVRTSISLPRQHALYHYFYSISLFGSPNGLCSSITESKHIKAVKEPWRRSSRYHALSQMLQILSRMDKMAALRRKFTKMGLLVGTTSSFIARIETTEKQDEFNNESRQHLGDDSIQVDDENEDDGGPILGEPSGAMSDVKLAARYGELAA